MLDLVYASIRDDVAFQHLPTELARHVGGRTGSIQVLSRDGALLLAADNWPDPDFTRRYATGNIHEDDPWLKGALAVNCIGRATDSAPLVSDVAFEQSRLYQDLLRPLGDDTRHCIGAVLETDYGLLGIGIHRPSREDATAQQLDAISRLLPHLRQAMDLRLTLASAINRAELAERSLDALPAAIVLVDAFRRPCLINDAARALLNGGEEIVIQRGALVAIDIHAHEKLCAAVQRATLAAEPAGANVAIPTRQTGNWLAIRVVPWRQDGKPLALLTIAEPFREPPGREAMLVELFGLTPAEAKTAAQLAEGLTPAEVAAKRKLRLPTIRTQIAQGMQKMDVRRTVDMIRLVERLGLLDR